MASLIPARWLQLPRPPRTSPFEAAPAKPQSDSLISNAEHKQDNLETRRFASEIARQGYPYPSPETSGSSSSPEMFEHSAVADDSATSASSHLPSPSSSTPSKRRPRKLKKPPPSAYPAYASVIELSPVTVSGLSFVPDDLPLHSNFPSMTVDMSPPASPHSSINGHGSTLYIPTRGNSVPSSPSMSMRSALTIASHSQMPLLNSVDLDAENRLSTSGIPKRKLTKRRPSLPAEPPSSYTSLSDGPSQFSETYLGHTHTYPPLPQTTSTSVSSVAASHHTLLDAVEPKPPQRRSTLSLGFRSRKNSENRSVPPKAVSVSESGHGSRQEGSGVHHPELQHDPPSDPTVPSSQSHPKSQPDATLVFTGVDLTHSPPELSNSPKKFTIGTEEILGAGPASPIRPVLTRRHAGLPAIPPRRRWTLASAMTDEGITDEVLVEELERMRRGDVSALSADDAWNGRNLRQQKWNGHTAMGDWGVDDWNGDGSTDNAGGCGLENGDVYGGSWKPEVLWTECLPKHHLASAMSAPNLAILQTSAWHTARRALLTCRELVRTERHYLAEMQTLLLGETLTAPPPLMIRYVKELVTVSDNLLAQLTADPSAWGVAAAFLGCESSLESALSGWCGVVGSWFKGQETQPTKSRQHSKNSVSKPKSIKVSPDDDSEVGLLSPLRRAAWRKSLPALPSINAATSDAKKLTTQKRARVRDLAILPTQRVMRYVLLYKDLLAHTPASSPSRALVERAYAASCRIAQKCDRAQGNAAFFLR